MFKNNYKKYALLFLCITFLISVCQFFASIAFNKSFMNMNVLDPIISSNILLPTCVTFGFSIFFIPYAHFAFTAQKEKDYGILETIGIDNISIRNLVILENTIVAVLALLAGLIIGTAFSALFYGVIIHAFDINGLETTLNWESFKVTIIITVAVDTLSILVIAFRTSKMTVKQLLSDERKVKEGMTSNISALIIGAVILIATAVYLFVFYNQNDSNALMICFPLSVLGVVLIVLNSISIINTIKRRNPYRYYRNMIHYSNIRYKFSSNKKMFCFTIALMGFIIFFQVFAFGVTQMTQKNANTYSPYHIAYMEFNDEAYPSTAQIDRTASDCGVDVTKNIELKYLVGLSGNQRYTVISTAELHRLSGRECIVPRGECIKISQYRTDDGYPHYEKPDSSPVSIAGKDVDSQYKVKKIRNEVIINSTALETDYCAVINNSDFNMLMKQSTKNDGGNIRIIQCSNIIQSEQLCKHLEQKYHLDSQYISAKYVDQHKAVQSNHFLLFVITIMNLLLFLLNMMMIHFKLMSGLDSDKRKYMGMWKVGYSFIEIQQILRQDVKTMMVWPAVLAVILGGTYVCGLLRLAATGRYAFICTAVVGTLILIMQYAISDRYSKYYLSRIF
jgi:hypothetical protein